MDREHRRELKHDKFVDEVGHLSQRARDNQRLLLTVTGIALALIIAGYGIYFYRTTREQKAQDALGNAIDSIDSPLQTPGQPPQPNAKFKTDAERMQKSEAMFRDVQKNYSGTDAADVANLYLARIDTARGDSATARKLFEGFISEHPKHLLVGAAKYSLYQIRIGNGEAQQVATELEAELGKGAGATLPPDTILALLARAYDVQGQPEKSKETYRRITTEFPDSPYALEAQRRIGGPAA